VLAEDVTDCDAIAVLLRRIAQEDHDSDVGVSQRKTSGCGHLRRKARAHLINLAQTCDATLIVHDLDLNAATGQLNDVVALRAELEAIEFPDSVTHHHVCIPVEELEAWFWSDQNVLDSICPDRSAKARNDPALIRKPKESLMRASRTAGGKPRFHTAMNKDLAAILNLDVCAARCPSFAGIREFVRSVIAHGSSRPG
jgi:hypothetical protein